MNLAGKHPAAVLASLAFLFVWLAGWTVGVAFIQSMLLSGEVPFLVIFLITHGGAEFYTLGELAAQVQSAADRPRAEPKLQLTHDGMTAAWPNGNGSVVVAAASGAVALVLHLMLWGSLAYAVRENPTGFSVAFAALLSVVWGYTAWRFVPAIGAHLRAQGDVEMRADLDSVRLTFAGSLSETDRRLPLLGLRIDDTDLETHGRVVMASGDEEVTVPLAPGAESTGMLDLLRTMAERATAPDEVETPEALRQLRSTAE